MALSERQLKRDEVALVWTIDRTELIENVYHLIDGVLELRPERYDMKGWPRGEPEKALPSLLDCFDEGGWFRGAFDETLLVGAAILENRFIGKDKDQLQLKFLHVSSKFRGKGLGRGLFEEARAEARARGARRMYVSATPSQNTIDFYIRSGCVLCREPDPELYALEPEDIHLLCET